MALGKSTIAKLIAGITNPSKGEILIEEKNTKEKKKALVAKVSKFLRF